MVGEIPRRQPDQPQGSGRGPLRGHSADRLSPFSSPDAPRLITADLGGGTVLNGGERGGERRERPPTGETSGIRFVSAQRPDPRSPLARAQHHEAMSQVRDHVSSSSHLSPTTKALLNWGLALTEIAGFFTGWSPADVVTAGEVIVGKTVAGHHMTGVERIVFGALAAIPGAPSRMISEAYYGFRYGYGPKKPR